MAEFTSLALRIVVPRKRLRGIPGDEREDELGEHLQQTIADIIDDDDCRIEAEEDRESPKYIHYIIRIHDIAVAKRESVRRLIENAGFRIAEELEDEEEDDEDADAPWRASLEPDDVSNPDDGDRLAGI